MEFIDGVSRSSVVFQSKHTQTPSATSIDSNTRNWHRLAAISFSVVLSITSLLCIQTEPYKSILIWVSLSLLLGPFAPPNFTGGDITVGQGSALDFPEEDEPEETHQIERRGARRRSKSIKTPETVGTADLIIPPIEAVKKGSESVGAGQNQGPDDVEEMGWSEEDLGLLKKQMAKNPAGKPGRWEAVTMAFSGRHKVDSVIKKAKELGELKPDGDFERFLRSRKALDARVKEEMEAAGGEGGWSNAEDVALLNAMKAFPKDVEMRWEKIAAALSGKSKAACFKRASELKKSFRSSKAAL